MSARDVLACAEAFPRMSVKTRHGAWRSVCAVYSDGSVGTIGVGGTGRFTILTAASIVAVREEQVS